MTHHQGERKRTELDKKADTQAKAPPGAGPPWERAQADPAAAPVPLLTASHARWPGSQIRGGPPGRTESGTRTAGLAILPQPSAQEAGCLPPRALLLFGCGPGWARRRHRG